MRRIPLTSPPMCGLRPKGGVSKLDKTSGMIEKIVVDPSTSTPKNGALALGGQEGKSQYQGMCKGKKK